MRSLCLRRVCFVTLVVLIVSLAALAQTAPITPAKATPPAKPAPKPAASAPKPKPAKLVAKTAPVSPQPAKAASVSNAVTPSPTPVPATAQALPGIAAQPVVNSPSTQSANNSSTSVPRAATPSAAGSGDSRTPVAGQGIGTFVWPNGWTLIAYGCFRSGTRLFCDFDTTSNNNTQAGVNIWSGAGGVNLVDDGGKITTRHNAFFVGDDGSQFTTAYVGQQPVRFIIEYDDVDQRYTSISLVLARNQIRSVPITLVDPSQPAGKMPARAGLAAPAQAAQSSTQGSGTGLLDKASNTVNNTNTQKKKAQSLWKSVQDAAQPR